VRAEESIAFLLDHQKPDGGFPYAAAGGSVVEATAFSLLALSGHDRAGAAVKRGTDYLASLQNANGGWLLFRGDNLSSAYGTALACLALAAIDAGGFKSRLDEAAFYLRNDHRYVKDADLAEDVWGWNNDTNVGTEPTAMAVLALKRLGSLPAEREAQAARFFGRLRCDDGGWSYGAPIDKNDPRSKTSVCAVLPQQLHVTALVLLAMQDKQGEFRDGLAIIGAECPKSRCPFSLSLSALAVHGYGGDNRDILSRLDAVMASDGQVRGMVFYQALTALAHQTSLGRNPLCLKR